MDLLQKMKDAHMIKCQSLFKISVLFFKGLQCKILPFSYDREMAKKIGALLTDLPKAFDCIPQDVIIAKLEAY